jgi:hypothetical protein
VVLGISEVKQLYNLARIILTEGEGKRVGKGENRQTRVHIADLSDLYVRLIEAAAAGGGNATWGKRGYYFSSTGDQVNSYTVIIPPTLTLSSPGVKWQPS